MRRGRRFLAFAAVGFLSGNLVATLGWVAALAVGAVVGAVVGVWRALDETEWAHLDDDPGESSREGIDNPESSR